MKNAIVILKINQDLVYRNAGQVIIGMFNEMGVQIETKLLPGSMFDQRTKLEVGMELKLVPKEVITEHNF